MKITDTVGIDWDRIQQASTLALSLHARQTRKGSTVPYAAHLWQVAGLVAEMGGSEDEIIAALLHDAVEDQGGLATLEKIRQAFGDVVAQIVLECSDSHEEESKLPWRTRKEEHLNSLADASPMTLRIMLADKIQNARSIVMERDRLGDSAFEKFNGKRDGTLWYYDRAILLFDRRCPSHWTRELARLIERMKQPVAAR
jgi:(p)ppGpp synthase/HD superfamily hydrolase